MYMANNVDSDALAGAPENVTSWWLVLGVYGHIKTGENTWAAPMPEAIIWVHNLVASEGIARL